METSIRNPREKEARRYPLSAILAVSISLLVILAALATTSILYYSYSQVLRQNLRHRLINIVELAALQQNGDKFEQITSADDPLYEEFRLQNLEIQKIDPDIAYVYTMRKDENGIYFVVDVGEFKGAGVAHYGERYFTPSATLQNNFTSLQSAITDQETYTDSFGSFLGGYAPIRNSQGERIGVIGVDIRADAIVAQERQFIFIALAVLGITAFILTIASWQFGIYINAPIKQLSQTTQRIALGDLHQRVNIKTPSQEINAVALDVNNLVDKLQGAVDTLETRVTERTLTLEQRTLELENRSREMEFQASRFKAVAMVARAISSIQDLQDLLPNIAADVSREFNFYHVGIFLLDEAKEYAVLVASNSEGGQRMLQRGHKLKIGEVGLVGFSAATGQARIALDTGEETAYFDNPDLPDTCSEMTIPLQAGSEVIGVLDVQSEQVGIFTDSDIELLSIVADQISIAIQNASQFQAAQKKIEAAQESYRRYIRSEWRAYTQEQNRIGYRYSKAGVGPLKAHIHSTEVGEATATGKTSASQQETRSQIIVPIKLRDEVIGILNVTADGEHTWDQDEVDITESVAERVALALENVRLLESSQSLASRERTITAVTSRIGASVNMRSILQTAVEELGRIIPGSDVVIQLGATNEDQ